MINGKHHVEAIARFDVLVARPQFAVVAVGR
jgi:hypothetical protein